MAAQVQDPHGEHPVVTLSGPEPIVYHGVYRKPGAPKWTEKCQPLMSELRLHVETGEIDLHNMERPPCCMPTGGCCGTGVDEKTAWATDLSSVTVIGKDKGMCAPCAACAGPFYCCGTYLASGCQTYETLDCGGRAGIFIVGPYTRWDWFDTKSFFIPITMEDARQARDHLKQMRRNMVAAEKRMAHAAAIKEASKPMPVAEMDR